MSQQQLAFLEGGSALARLMRAKDWSASPLGAPAGWPQSLRSVADLMLGSAFPMFVAWGPQLAMLYNDSYAEVLGAKHPASLGAPFADVWRDIETEISPYVSRALAGEAFYVEDLPLRMRRRGFDEQTWFTFSYSPVRDESGAIAGFYCACTETTKTVLAQQQLLVREEWLQSLFDQAPGFAAVLRGPSHVFEMVNDAYRQITGHRQLEGLSLAEALPEIVGQGFGDWLDEVYRTGKPFIGRSIPVTVSRGAGNPDYDAFVDFMYQPLRNADGKVEGIFVQGHDVTDQHRAQQALRDADRQKDEFLATLAHELRNPLAPIRTAVHLLSSPRANEGAKVRATEVIQRQVGHMSRLLDDLIDVARITQRRLVLRKEWITVQSIVDSAVEASKPAADSKQHRLLAHVESPQAQVFGDGVRLAQVLSNLLNNAAKYTDPGGTIVLEAGPDRQPGWLRFCVSDTGIGMSPEALKSVFTMFAQEQAALDRAEGGLGIGLALAKGLVELHGGAIEAESEGPGRGSRFIVRLPLEARVQDSGPPVVGPLPSTAATPRRTVVLADDNADAAEVLAELLRMASHEVHTAHDGTAAAELAERIRPDVLILDIGMPGRNGYEVAKDVRAQPWGRRTLLIAATGWGQEQDRQQAMAAGFNVHLTKPFAPDELLGVIQAHTS